MKQNHNSNDATQAFMKVGKRIAITVVCCIPVLLVFGYLTKDVLNNALQIVCFMLIMAVAVAVVEVVARTREKKQKETIETERDVFK